MRFKWYRFGTYLAVGLIFFGAWATYNYTTYVTNEKVAQVQIAENNQIINETVADIEVEQQTLQNIQRVMAPPPPISSGMAMSIPDNDPVVDELQARIDKLEEDKKALEKERSYIKKTILDSFNVFKGIRTDNPLVNAIIIPIFLYFMKKLIDLLFRKMEDRHEHKHAI